MLPQGSDGSQLVSGEAIDRVLKRFMIEYKAGHCHPARGLEVGSKALRRNAIACSNRVLLSCRLLVGIE